MYIRLGKLLEKKNGLEMSIKTHSNIKYLCVRRAIGDWLAKCGLLVAISYIQGSPGGLHHLIGNKTI